MQLLKKIKRHLNSPTSERQETFSTIRTRITLKLLMATNSYSADYAKTGRSKCKAPACKQMIAAKSLRLGKSHPSGFHDGDETNWYHAACCVSL
jgi:hypothetical protein